VKHLLVTNDFPPKIGGIQSLLWEWWRRLPPDRFAVLTSPYAGAAEFDAEQSFRIERTPEPVLLPHPIMTRRVNELARTVFGQFNAVEAIQQRSNLNRQIYEQVLEAIDTPIVVIESVQVEDVAFSTAYEQSVEARMMAEVEVQRRSQELEQQRIQAQIVVTQAEGAAEARIAEARAQAEATILAGEAEAQAIRAKGEALRDSPELIALVTAEAWNGQLPTTMPPGGTVPFINVGQ